MSGPGPDILPKANPAGTSVWLEESNQFGETPTNWISHPSGIGYRRPSPGITTTTGSGSTASSSNGPPIAGNSPSMDTGLGDAGNTSEFNRINNNFITGGNENPTAMQPGPISHAEQLPTNGLDPLLAGVQGTSGGPIWSIYGNPLYYSENSASRIRNHVDSSQSGRAGGPERNYGNAGATPGGLASVPVSEPADNRMLGPGNKPTPAPPRQAYADAEAPLGPGDLVIIVAGSPATEKQKVTEDNKSLQRGSTYEDFENAVTRAKEAGKTTFALARIRPNSIPQLASAIQQALRDNGGKKFRRIFILSHAGGPSASPSINFESGPRLTSQNVPAYLVNAVDGALEASGVLVTASCGYYYENMRVSIVGGKEMHERVPRDPNDPEDIAYQNAWLKRLADLAKAFKRAVFADASDSWPSADPLDAGTIRRNLDSRPPAQPKAVEQKQAVRIPNVLRIGFGPNGERLTNP